MALLMERGVDVDKQIPGGSTALHAGTGVWKLLNFSWMEVRRSIWRVKTAPLHCYGLLKQVALNWCSYF
ncbi:hypothetical protein PF003_g17500 [Phytophthora fragariae]|nr:hypothetical protein PF003_g17500 [Phytophthora fragariae]